MELVQIETADGTCPTRIFRPGGKGPWPAVLLVMDGVGMRPAMEEMAERIAAHGYYTVLPDLFYRSGPYAPKDAKTVFSIPAQRKDLIENFMGKLGPVNAMRDVGAMLAYLGAQPDVRGGAIGITGYCMGGTFSLLAAGTFGDRIAAAASYHGGYLATDKPESPHLLAPQMTARVYVAGAIEDASFPDDMKARLEAALAAAGVRHTVETYPAQHGWVPTDSPVYDEAAADKHWQTLFALFDATLV